MAVALGRKPISYKYYPDMTKHFAHGSEKTLKDHNKVEEWLKWNNWNLNFIQILIVLPVLKLMS